MQMACLYPMELEVQGSKSKNGSFHCLNSYSMGLPRDNLSRTSVELFYILLRTCHCHLHETGMSLSNGIRETRE